MSKDPTRNRTRNHSSCGALPQPTAAPLAPPSQAHSNNPEVPTAVHRHFTLSNCSSLTGKLCKCGGSQISSKSRNRPTIPCNMQPVPQYNRRHRTKFGRSSDPATLNIFLLPEISGCRQKFHSRVSLVHTNFQQMSHTVKYNIFYILK
jgi:hypothetical protein